MAWIQILKKMSLFERLYTGEWLSESKAEVEGKMSLFESLYTGEWLSESKEVEDEDMENIPKVTVKKEPLLLQSVQRAFVATGAPTRARPGLHAPGIESYSFFFESNGVCIWRRWGSMRAGEDCTPQATSQPEAGAIS